MNAYARLMRLDKPTGIWLLFWPCVWGLALGGRHAEWLDLIERSLLFFFGAVVMRSAGCIVNDIWDRKLDAKVERTRARPLANGEIKPRAAILLLILLLVIALLIWTQLHWLTRVLSVVSLALVAAYPAMKRITWWPQAFLGVTFNFGILMGFAETAHLLSIPAMMMYLGAMFWTIGYDTVYAHQDIEDDRMAGIKSTALRFAGHPRRFVALCYAIAMLLWWLAAMVGALHWPVYIALLAVGAHLLWQLAEWRPADAANCLKIFKSNVVTAMLMVVVALLPKLF
jgi:4-hydroxybenzoate polyprenyltransferase